MKCNFCFVNKHPLQKTDPSLPFDLGSSSHGGQRVCIYLQKAKITLKAPVLQKTGRLISIAYQLLLVQNDKVNFIHNCTYVTLVSIWPELQHWTETLRQYWMTCWIISTVACVTAAHTIKIFKHGHHWYSQSQIFWIGPLFHYFSPASYQQNCDSDS